MPSEHKVAENETLAQVADKTGFVLNTLVIANPEAFPLLNPQVLAPGMTIRIPDKKSKQVDQSSGTKAVYTRAKTPKQFISIKLEDPNKEIQSAELSINGGVVPIKPVDANRTIDTINITTTDPLPEGDLDGSIRLTMISALTGAALEKTIKLNIGGLDPIIDPSLNFFSGSDTDSIAAKKAVQKILTNLGYYNGAIDGKLEEEASILAIARFQNDRMPAIEFQDSDGIANLATCLRLKQKEHNRLGTVQRLKNGK